MVAGLLKPLASRPQATSVRSEWQIQPKFITRASESTQTPLSIPLPPTMSEKLLANQRLAGEKNLR